MRPAERKYDLYSHDAKVNAYDIYALMRREDPVFQQIGFDGATKIWFVTRYEDVETVLRDDVHFARDPRRAFPPEQHPAATSLRHSGPSTRPFSRLGRRRTGSLTWGLVDPE